MHGRISPRRVCNPCGYTMIYDVQRTTKIDGMGPFNIDMKHLIVAFKSHVPVVVLALQAQL